MFKKYGVLAAILFLAFTLRIWNITTSPSGLSIDEVSIGYNAWSIVTTGKDEHGEAFPLFFKAFGEYKLPIYIYSVALVQFLDGPTDLSVRLPAVLFGLGTIICFYFFSKLFLINFFNEKLTQTGAYLAAFLMAISSWHIQFTRTGFEASSALFFITLGVYLFFKGKNPASLNYLIFSILSFTLSLYCYNSARIVTPVLVISLSIAYFKSYKIYHWITAFLLGFNLAVPFLLFSLSPEGLARAKEVVIFYSEARRQGLEPLDLHSPQTQNVYIEVFLNYLKNISPYYLFYYGDPTLSHTTPHRMNLLYLIEAPFFYAGLILLILKIRKSAFLLIWFLIGSLPAAITILNPHALRSFLILPALLLISVFGFLNFISLIKSHATQKAFLIAYSFCLLVSCLYFLNTYHNFYIKDSGWDWLSDIKSVSREVELLKNDYDQIYFEDGGFKTIAYLWHLKYPPIKYHEVPGKKIFGNLHFNYQPSSINQNGKDLYISRNSNLEAPLVQTIYYPNSTPALYLYKS